MARFEFKTSRSIGDGMPVCEVIIDGTIVGTIIPSGERSIRVLTRNLRLPIRTETLTDGITATDVQFGREA